MDDFTNSFWSISIYIDKDENLVGVPCGLSEENGVSDIDVVLRLASPYSDQQLEKYIEKVIDACYTKVHNDESEYSTMEKFTKKKGFANATSDYTLISIVKTKDSFSIMPAFNDFERGPVMIDDDEVMLPIKFSKGDMANALRRMIGTYVKANEAVAAMLKEDE